MGPTQNGVEFLEEALPGIEGYSIDRMMKSHRGKLYINDSCWGPEADSIEYGYRVPFGKFHVFISKIGESGPESDICSDIIEPTHHAKASRPQAAWKHVFPGCSATSGNRLHGMDYAGSRLHSSRRHDRDRHFSTGSGRSRLRQTTSSCFARVDGHLSNTLGDLGNREKPSGAQHRGDEAL